MDIESITSTLLAMAKCENKECIVVKQEANEQPAASSCKSQSHFLFSNDQRAPSFHPTFAPRPMDRPSSVFSMLPHLHHTETSGDSILDSNAEVDLDSAGQPKPLSMRRDGNSRDAASDCLVVGPSATVVRTPVAEMADPDILPPQARVLGEDGKLRCCYWWAIEDTMKCKLTYPVTAELCRVTGALTTPLWCPVVGVLACLAWPWTKDTEEFEKAPLFLISDRFFCTV